MRIEPRDLQVLSETFLSRVVRRSDLIGLGFFGSVPRCNARLLSLRQEGFLSARYNLSGAELRAPIYLCAAKGARLAAQHLGLPVAQAVEIHRAGIRDLALRHALRITDLRLHLIRNLQDPELTLESWSHELECQHDFEFNRRLVGVKPDALAILRHLGKAHPTFIEVDLGNASLPKFREKVDRYELYRESGAFADAYGIPSFLVLTVTTDERRLSNLSTLTGSQSFAFTTWPRLRAGQLGDVIFTCSQENRRFKDILGGYGC